MKYEKIPQSEKFSKNPKIIFKNLKKKSSQGKNAVLIVLVFKKIRL